jgi:flagellar operon protein
MNILDERFLSAKQIQGEYLGNLTQTQDTRRTGNGQTFGDILGRVQNEAVKELKFSKHATDRLATRDINLDDSQLNRLQEGIAKAGMKGIKESLMIMDKLAFIVNVPSGTVVTALDSNLSNEQVFTNIDGAVIV